MTATAAHVAAPERNEDPPKVLAPPEASAELALEVVEEPTELAEETLVEEPSEQNTLAPTLSQAEREAMVERLRASAWMPPALKDRLAALVTSSADAAADGAPRVKVADVMAAIDDTLPDFVRLRGRTHDRAEHPAGDAFFRADAQGELTEDDAESIARSQLARSGLLRGQRARAG